MTNESSGTQSGTAYKVAIAGLGAIGHDVACRLDAGEVNGLTVSAVAARDHDKARRNLASFNSAPELLPLAELGAHADIVIECAPKTVFREIAEGAIANGCTFMPLSVGALLDHMDLLDKAAETGARVFVPTGALLGLDAVKAVAEGEVKSVVLVTRKPPDGLRGAPHLVDNKISVDNLDSAKQVFAGTARQAAKAFPANVNVAAALALAGIGPERTTVEVWADPSVNRNIHTITVDADASSFTMTIQNVPSDNAATGKITALSVMAALRRFTSPLIVGT